MRASNAARLFFFLFNQSDHCFPATSLPLYRPCLSSLFSEYDADISYLFELLRWQNLTRLHEIDKVTVVYKSLNGLAPEYLCSRFTTRELANNPSMRTL